MENTELKHILIAYKSTNIGLQQTHDEILRLFNAVGRSEQLCHCGKPEKKAYSPCCSLTCWCEQFE